jgi:hypothetical protein
MRSRKRLRLLDMEEVMPDDDWSGYRKGDQTACTGWAVSVRKRLTCGSGGRTARQPRLGGVERSTGRRYLTVIRATSSLRSS